MIVRSGYCLLWKPGNDDWQSAGTLKEMAGFVPPPPPPPPLPPPPSKTPADLTPDS